MKKDILRQIPKGKKVEFLNKLQSGNFNLLKPYNPQPGLNFDLQENGLYLCKETGKELTKEQIVSLPGYKIQLELVGNKLQISGEKPASGYVLVPFSKNEYLASLLRNKADVILTFDETDKTSPFKSGNNAYSFNELMTMRNESPGITFLMDQRTKNEYLKALEKWC